MQKSRHTFNKPRKRCTRSHSSLVSFSSRILSRFAESVSSHRSSSTNWSTHCKKKWTVNMNYQMQLWYAQPFSFRRGQASSMSMTTAPSCQVSVESRTHCLPWSGRFSTFLFALMMSVPDHRGWETLLVLEYIQIHTLTTIALISPTSSRDVGTCASGCFGSKCGDLL